MTEEERILKLEHDAWLAKSIAAKNEALVEYIALMDYPEILETEEDEVSE